MQFFLIDHVYCTRTPEIRNEERLVLTQLRWKMMQQHHYMYVLYYACPEAECAEDKQVIQLFNAVFFRNDLFAGGR